MNILTVPKNNILFLFLLINIHIVSRFGLKRALNVNVNVVTCVYITPLALSNVTQTPFSSVSFVHTSTLPYTPHPFTSFLTPPPSPPLWSRCWPRNRLTWSWMRTSCRTPASTWRTTWRPTGGPRTPPRWSPPTPWCCSLPRTRCLSAPRLLWPLRLGRR